MRGRAGENAPRPRQININAYSLDLVWIFAWFYSNMYSVRVIYFFFIPCSSGCCLPMLSLSNHGIHVQSGAVPMPKEHDSASSFEVLAYFFFQFRIAAQLNLYVHVDLGIAQKNNRLNLVLGCLKKKEKNIDTIDQQRRGKLKEVVSRAIIWFPDCEFSRLHRNCRKT